MNSDIIFCIFEYLTIKDLLNSSLINKLFNTTSKNELLWKRFCDKEYEKLVENDYRVNYKSWTVLGKFLKKNRNNMRDAIKCHSVSLPRRDLESIPNELNLLKNVTHVELNNNYLEDMTPILSLLNLKTLHLDYNKIENIPQEIGNLTNLEVLYISYNNLKSISESIGMLTKLSWFSIDNNNLKSIPESISLLTNLCEFYIDPSQKELVPKSFCKKLMVLDPREFD
jgi:Leucine-rich repeat (LRR) protein